MVNGQPLFSLWSNPSRRQVFLAFKSVDGDSITFLKQSTSYSADPSLTFATVQFGAAGSNVAGDRRSLSSSPSSIAMKVVDIQAYDQDSLSLLLQDPRPDGAPCLRQFHSGEILNHLAPLSASTSKSTDALSTTAAVKYFLLPPLGRDDAVKLSLSDGGPSEAFEKRLDNLKTERIAVSGSRKVCCVLFTSKRRVCLFLTDVLDDEEEEEEEDEEEEEEGLEEVEGDIELEREEEDEAEEVKEGDLGEGEDDGVGDLREMGNLELDDLTGDHESDKENDLVE